MSPFKIVMVKILLKNGKVVSSEGIFDRDVLIEDGKISAVKERGDVDLESSSKAEIIDCTGLHILPGLIDAHVHFRDPGFSEKGDFASESRAAAKGGVTTVFDMPNTVPPTTTLAALEKKRRIAAEKSVVNFGLYFGATAENFSEIERAKNIVGVKVYVGSTTGNLLLADHEALEKFFEFVSSRRPDLTLVFHAEDEILIREHMKKYEAESEDPAVHSLVRNADVALRAVRTILHLAKKYEAKVHITHVSTAAELAEIKKFKNGKVTCDVTPHHLFLTVAAYEKLGNFVKVNPPLRSAEDKDALWAALKGDDAVIDMIASDHAPHTREEKKLPCLSAPAGVPGVQAMLPLLLDAVSHGMLSLTDVVRLTAENPAHIFTVSEKGKIAQGFSADVAIVDMKIEKKLTEKDLLYKCGWSPYTGFKLRGSVVMTLVNGEVIYRDGEISDTESRGKEVVRGYG